MRKWKRFVVIMLVVVLVVFAVAVAVTLALEPVAQTASDLSWQVIASGGATMSSPSYTMLSTTGQPVTGSSSSSGFSVLSGYWYGFQEFVWRVFLPFITKG